MIRRAVLVARSAHRAQIRGYASRSPSSKVSVVPFGPSMEEARARMLMYALIASPSPSNFLYAGLLKMFGTGIDTFAREFGLGDIVKLKSIVPAYYPIWRVDAIAQGPVSPLRGGEETSAYLSVQEAYVPGNPYAPLSYLSLAVPPLEEDLRQYDPSRDLNQLGSDKIVEVPFTVNPLSMVDEIKKKVGRRCELPGGYKLDGSKWQDKMVAAYPIMFPLYIAEFEATFSDEDVRRFPVIMDAHDKSIGDCRCSIPIPSEVRQTYTQKGTEDHWFVSQPPFAPNLSFEHSESVPALMSKEAPPAEQIAKSYANWMSPFRHGSAIPPSPTLAISEQSEIDWNDPRIQSWNSEEREENGEYVEKANAVYHTLTQFEHISLLMSNKGGFTIEIEGEKPSGDKFTFGFEGEAGKLQKELAELKPKWLRAYDEQVGRNAATATKEKGEKTKGVETKEEST